MMAESMVCLSHWPGLVLPVLGALPDSLIILVSGIGVPREVAQEQARVQLSSFLECLLSERSAW